MAEKEDILWFKDVGKNDVGIAGGKAASLGEMTRASFPIPPGFIVTSAAYFNYLKDAGIRNKVISLADSIDVDDTKELTTITEQIRSLIKGTIMRQHLIKKIIDAYKQLCKETGQENVFVAVRSSATAEDLPSISEDEMVLITVNDEPMFKKMKDVYAEVLDNNNADIKIPAMKDNKIKWTNVEQIYKHYCEEKKLYRIETETGREITVSPKHSLIILNENTLNTEVIDINKVKGNEYVPVTRKIPLLLKKNDFIDTSEFVKGNDVVECKNKLFIKNNSQNWSIGNGLNKKIRLTKDFAYFLGLYLAEGSTYKNNCTIITNSEKEIMERLKKALIQLELWHNQKTNKHSIRVYCKALVRFLHETTGAPLSNRKGKGKLCSVKRVPDFVFGLEKELIAEFLKGCFDGDGCVEKSYISYSSTSKMLISGIIKLLEMLEVDFYLRRKRNCLEICLPYSQAEKFRENIGFESRKKIEKLDELVRSYNEKTKHPQFKNNLFISEELSEKIRKSLELNLPKETISIVLCPECNKKINKSSKYIDRERYYCPDCKKAFYEKQVKKEMTEIYRYYDEKRRFKKYGVPWNKGLISGFYEINRFKKLMKKYGVDVAENIFGKEILWDRIKKVEEIPYTGWVYDFCVPGVENFAAGIGGIITHNSASFAGQQETYLNVSGNDELIESVQRCWASLFTARATYYRKKQKFKTADVGIAVAVQKMVNSESAGVMFTAEPTGDESKIVIESGFGLGESVVSGSITPDTYVVEKKSLKILSKNIGRQEYSILRDSKGKNFHKKLEEETARKQKISDNIIIELAKIGKKIEEHYGKPQDIEWAIESGTLYITQSRPITTMGLKEKVEEEKKIEVAEEKKLVKGLSGCPGIVTGNVRVVPSVDDVHKVKEGDILVTKMTNPDWVPIMKKAKGIITDEGGRTCHAAIISRELGIPCVVGTGNATQKLKDGLLVTVNGYNGEIYEGKVTVIQPQEEEEKTGDVIKEEEVDDLEKVLEITTCTSCTDEMNIKEKLVAVLTEHAARVKVNVALPEAAKRAAETGADGVGLLRAEHMITASGMHPAEFIRQGKKEELIETVKKGIKIVLDEFKGKPVWYRTFDARTDEFTHLDGGEKEPEEDNPMLGWHGIRRDLDDYEMLEAQFIAIKRLVEEGYHHIGIMLPFLQSIEEFKRAVEIAKKVGLEHKKKVVEFGVMIETPAACWIIDDLIKEGVDFVSFGTNDLTQLTLGIDRNNQKIQKQFNEMHPAVLGEIEMVINKCKGTKVKTSICGQAGSNPKMVRKLIRMGISSVSANIDAVQEIKKSVLIEEKRILMEKLRES